VCLTKCDNVTTGYQWKYSYFDGVKIKVLSSYDLIKLRQKVDNRGLPWTITDSKLAIDSYKLNKDLLEKHDSLTRYKDRENSSSGVRYVYRTPDKGSRRGFYWIYVNNHHEGQKSYTSNSLLRLKERIESEGLKWTVVNQKLYKKLLNQEKDFV
jgi:D-mannonate dehydratase